MKLPFYVVFCDEPSGVVGLASHVDEHGHVVPAAHTMSLAMGIEFREIPWAPDWSVLYTGGGRLCVSMRAKDLAP